MRHGADRPFGVRQEHVPAVPEPHERYDRGRPGRGRHPARRRGHLQPRHRRGRTAEAGRDGVPEVEPVPQVDLGECGVRPQGGGREGPLGAGWDRRAVSASRGVVGRGERPAAGLGVAALRRPAAAALHRPGPGDRPRGAVDGRARFGARPGFDLSDRRPDRGAEEAVHDRDRDP